jgi:uncharacterized membrane protein
MSDKKNHPLLLEIWESMYGPISRDKAEQVSNVHDLYHSFRAKSLARRKPIDVVADKIIGVAGTILSVELHITVFALWALINTGVLPVVPVFDPYPFGFLTVIISMEAIFLALLILISQNRQAAVADLREEMNFQITLQSEQEITKLLKLIKEMHESQGFSSKKDYELEKMVKKLDPDKMEKEIEREFEDTQAGNIVLSQSKSKPKRRLR